jgi:hypothetical protein
VNCVVVALDSNVGELEVIEVAGRKRKYTSLRFHLSWVLLYSTMQLIWEVAHSELIVDCLVKAVCTDSQTISSIRIDVDVVSNQQGMTTPHRPPQQEI